jgi:hypothetical protein
MTTELKPCPFCGGNAVYDRRGSHRQSTIVECTECSARLESNDYLFPERAWNTRADLPDDKSAARIAELEARVSFLEGMVMSGQGEQIKLAADLLQEKIMHNAAKDEIAALKGAAND